MRPLRERPDGVRSCRQGEHGVRGAGGTWVECSALVAEGGLWTRVGLFTVQCVPVARAITIGRINDMLERARHGELHLRPAGAKSGGEVVAMGIRPEVLELVLGKQLVNKKPLHLRAYFTEPVDAPGQLLLLSVAWKHDHPLGKKEQDAHAKDAFQRFRNDC